MSVLLLTVFLLAHLLCLVVLWSDRLLVMARRSLVLICILSPAFSSPWTVLPLVLVYIALYQLFPAGTKSVDKHPLDQEDSAQELSKSRPSPGETYGWQQGLFGGGALLLTAGWFLGVLPEATSSMALLPMDSPTGTLTFEKAWADIIFHGPEFWFLAVLPIGLILLHRLGRNRFDQGSND
ncbi:MAG: hypothetical protein KDK39_03345 [Leptospiraceae bacterium]|nr:hypothetical protein [Leptospiraceae bacterium]